MTQRDWQRELRETRDRKAIKRISEQMLREQFREVDEALNRWHSNPPPPVPDAEPGYKP